MKILLIIFLLFNISCVKDRDSLIEDRNSSKKLESKEKTKKRVNSHINLAIDALKKRDYPSAYENLFKAQKIDDQNEKIYNILGLTYLYDGKNSLAIKNLKKAISLRKDYSEAHLHLGIAYGELTQYDNAIKEFKKALNNIFYKTPWNAYTNLGKTYFLTKDYENAIKTLNRSLSKNSAQCIPYDILSEIYSELQNIEESEFNFKEALKYCNNKSFIYKKRALFFLSLKKEKEALNDFENCLKYLSVKDRKLKKECNRYIELIR